MVDTSSTTIIEHEGAFPLPATVIHHLAAPYRRATPIRHRKNVQVWAARTALAYVTAWAAQPIRVTRRRHLAYWAMAVTFAVVALTTVVGR